MTWIELKRKFVENLTPIYGQNESEALFYWAVEEALKWNKAQANARIFDTVEPEIVLQFEKISLELENQNPIQYIFGKGYCYGRTFKVNPDVLIPRGETESLIHLVLNSFWPTSYLLIDIGTGSGCIAINIKSEQTHIKVLAMDISQKALNIAEENAQLNGVEVEWINADILASENWSLFPDNSLGAIVSNPPYVCMSEKEKMSSNVLNHEPHLALFVDDQNPLIFYLAISQFAQQKLVKNGLLAFEINEAFGLETKQILTELGFRTVTIHQDIHNKDRMVSGIKA